eukprot:sb/3475462/
MEGMRLGIINRVSIYYYLCCIISLTHLLVGGTLYISWQLDQGYRRYLERWTLYLHKSKLDIESAFRRELEISAVRPETRVRSTYPYTNLEVLGPLFGFESPGWRIWRQNLLEDCISKNSTHGGLFI